MFVWLLTSCPNSPDYCDANEYVDVALEPGEPFASEQAAMQRAQREFNGLIPTTCYPLTWKRYRPGYIFAVAEDVNKIWQVVRKKVK